MSNGIRLFFGLFVILLITPQTQKDNILLRLFHESGFFMNYTEAKNILQIMTWFSMIFFMFLLLV